jgi:hypothetical protein
MQKRYMKKLREIIKNKLIQKRDEYVFLALFLASSLLAFIWFRKGDIMGGGESGLVFYNLERFFDISRFSWTDLSLGNNVGIGTGAIPAFWLLSRLEIFHIPGYLIQALFFGSAFFISGVFIYFLIKELFPDLSLKYVVPGVFFYWFNPLSLANVWNRFLYNYMVFWAFLPMAFFLFVRGLNKKDYLYSFLISLGTVLFSFALTSFVFSILLWFLFICTLGFYLFAERGNFGFYLKYFILTFISFTLLNFWWIGQLFSFVFSNGYSTVATAFFTSTGNLGTLTSLSQRLGQLTNVLRFLHITFFTEGPIWAKVFTFPLVAFFEFLITGIILWTIYRYRQMRNVLFLGLLFLIIAFLTKGDERPFGEVYRQAFSRFTPLQVFRNPFEKFGFLLPLISAPLFSFSLSKIRLRYLYPTVVFVVGIVWGFPFWTGLVFTWTEGVEPKFSKLISYEVEVPNYYKEANEWLNKQGNDFRFISLPLGGEGMTYTWKKPYSGVELSSTLFDAPNVSFNTTIPLFDQVAGNLEKTVLTKNGLPGIASLLNVRYVVLRDDIDWKTRALRDPETIATSLDSNPDLKKNETFGDLTIYSLPSANTFSKVWVPFSIIKVYPNESIEDFAVAGGVPGEAFYSAPDNINLPNTERTLIKSDAIIFLPQQRVYSAEEALNSLLYVKYLPGSFFYKLSLAKEVLERVRVSDPTDLYVFDLTHLGKRVAELYRLADSESSEKLVTEAITAYFNTLDEVVTNYPEKFENSPHNDYWRMTSEELRKHLVLLQDAEKSASGRSLSSLKDATQKLKQVMVGLGFSTVYPLAEETQNQQAGIWTFRFNVPTDSIYDILLEDDNWEKFYHSLSDSLELQVDSQLRSFVPQKAGTLIKLAGIRLAKGVHEISFSQPQRNNLILEAGDIDLTSDKDPIASFNIFPFDPYASYEVSFDYWIKKGSRFDLFISSDNDVLEENGPKPYFNKSFINDGYNNDFQSATVFYSPRDGSNSNKTIFKAEPFSFCPKQKFSFMPSPCDDETEKKLFEKTTEVILRNISVKKVFDNKMFLLAADNQMVGRVPSISYSKIDPTEYRVHVEGAENPFTLILSELYFAGWEARLADGTKIEENKHFLVNSYANGWMIDRLGNYDLILKFAPQNLLDVGKKISVLSLFFVIAFLGFKLFKKLRRSA